MIALLYILSAIILMMILGCSIQAILIALYGSETERVCLFHDREEGR